MSKPTDFRELLFFMFVIFLLGALIIMIICVGAFIIIPQTNENAIFSKYKAQCLENRALLLCAEKEMAYINHGSISFGCKEDLRDPNNVIFSFTEGEIKHCQKIAREALNGA